MSGFEEKLDAVQQWMQQSRSADFEQTLTEVEALIRQANSPTQSEQAETNVMLKSQLAACERAMITQQKNFDDMEEQLQKRTADCARLNLRLKKQAKEHKHTQTLEREQ